VYLLVPSSAVQKPSEVKSWPGCADQFAHCNLDFAFLPEANVVSLSPFENEAPTGLPPATGPPTWFAIVAVDVNVKDSALAIVVDASNTAIDAKTLIIVSSQQRDSRRRHPSACLY
jgi:hypothetical protein